MPYCETAFHPVIPDDIEHMLSAFTRENFVGGQVAYHLGNGSYSIDAGENDIRAIYDPEDETVRFFCRYERDLSRYEIKLQSFAAKHGIKQVIVC
jgi:hypothetical protein